MEKLIGNILQCLSSTNHDLLNTLNFAENLKEDHQNVIAAVQLVQAWGKEVVECEQRLKTDIILTKEGQLVLENGSLEAIAFEAVPPSEAGVSLHDFKKLVSPSVRKSGMSKAVKNGWLKVITIKGDVNGSNSKVIRLVDKIYDSLRSQLEAVSKGIPVDSATLSELKKRKLLFQTREIYYTIRRGNGFTPEITQLETQLTSEMLANGTWKEKQFKPYNFGGKPPFINSGCLHPLLQMHSQLRSNLLEMGFSEKPPNCVAQLSFNPTDVIRSVADEFYSHPHPVRLFSINRIVQKEKVGATFLPQYHNIEAFAADENLNLGNVIAITKEFFDRLGFGLSKMKFKPNYIPEMGPAMKVHSYVEGSKKWVEVGKCGMIRPEILLSLGWPKNVRVVMWSFHMERLFMILSGVDNIINISNPFGHRVDRKKIYKNQQQY